MARKFLTPIDLNKLELQNAAIQNLASDPSSPVAGQIYYNTVSNEMRVYNGSAFEAVGLNGVTASAAEINLLDGVTASTAELNILDGVTATAAELNYVDGVTSAIQTQLDAKAPTASPTFTGTVSVDSSIVFEGATADAYETTLQVTDPTADRTITLQNASGTVAFLTDISASISSTDDVPEGGNLYFTNERVDDRVNGLIVAGTGLDKTYDDVANTYTLDIDNTVITSNDTGTVTSTMIANGTIVNADINNSAAIALSKLATDPLARANHTGSQAASTISDFDTQVRTSRLDQMAAPTASVGLNSQKITGLATPTSNTDAATKAYVDATATGLDVKESVRVATAAAGTLNTSFANGQTVDGVVLATGDRILLKNQASALTNGIYTVNASGAPTRATDADASIEVTAGLFVFISEGTANGNTGWVLTTDDAITLDTTALTFTQFSGSGAFTAGWGLTLDGVDFAVGEGDGITVNNNDVAIDTAVVVRKYASLLGDGVATEYTLSHNLGTRDILVSVYDAATYDEVVTDVYHFTTSSVKIGFAVAPASNAYRVVVHA